jgi:hypothetical protein
MWWCLVDAHVILTALHMLVLKELDEATRELVARAVMCMSCVLLEADRECASSESPTAADKNTSKLRAGTEFRRILSLGQKKTGLVAPKPRNVV